MSNLCWVCWSVVLILLYKVSDWWLHRRRVMPDANVRSVVITGCDTGFGRILAERLSASGWTVVAACLTKESAKELGDLTGVISVQMNVCDEGVVESTAEWVKEELHKRGVTGVWGIVNNAGIAGSKAGPACFLKANDFKEVLDVNLIGMQNVTRAFLPQLLHARGRIVNTSSILGRLALPGSAAYTVSKFGVQALSDCYRRELKPFGICVSCIEPGFFRTNITEKKTLGRAVQEGFNSATAELRDAFGKVYRDEAFRSLNLVLSIGSSRISKVVDAYESALTDATPRARYMVGWDAKLLYWPLSIVPEWLSDTFFTLLSPTPAAVI